MNNKQKTIIVDLKTIKFPDMKEITEAITGDFLYRRRGRTINSGVVFFHPYMICEIVSYWMEDEVKVVYSSYNIRTYWLKTNELVWQTYVSKEHLQLVWLAGQEKYKNKFIFSLKESGYYNAEYPIEGIMNVK